MLVLLVYQILQQYRKFSSIHSHGRDHNKAIDSSKSFETKAGWSNENRPGVNWMHLDIV